jgi:hypothetical protein
MRSGKERVEVVGCDHVDGHHRCCHDAVQVQHVVWWGQVERKAEHLSQVLARRTQNMYCFSLIS